MIRFRSFWVIYRRHILLIGAVIFLTYGVTLRNSFIWDDQTYIVTWPEIRSVTNIPKLLSGDLPGAVTGTYRPLRSLHYVVSYALYGTNPTAWHLQALFLHMAAGILVFVLGILVSDTVLIALPAALLFSTHPVNSEAVAFATAAMDIPGVIYLLLSVIVYWLFLAKSDTKLLLLSLFFAVCAYLSHEQTLILPLLIWLVHSWHERWFVTTKKQVTIIAYYIVPVVLYVFIRFALLHVGLRDTSQHMGYFNTLLAGMLKLWRYAEVLTVPVRLTSVAAFPSGSAGVFALTIPQALLSPYAWTTLCGFILLLTTLPNRLKHNPVAGFVTGWILVSLLPVINILPTNLTYAERYMYLPSVGFCLGIAWVFYRLSRVKISHKKSSVSAYRIWVLAAVTVIVYGTRTAVRSLDYRDNITFWTVASGQSPQSDAVWNNLGNAYAAADGFDTAIQSFRKAVSIRPQSATYHGNLGNALIASGDRTEGQKELETARSLAPANITHIVNLVSGLAKQGKTDEAIQRLNAAIAENPLSPELSFVLGNLYIGNGDTEGAVDAFRTAIRLNPAFTDAYNNLAVLYLSLKDPQSAIRILTQATEKNPADASLYYNLGGAYEAIKDTEHAREAYSTAVRLAPSFTQAANRKKALTPLQ